MIPSQLLAEANAYPGDTPEERWAGFVESKLVEQGQPAFSPWWFGTIDQPGVLRQFWRSSKSTLVVLGANRSVKTHTISLAAAVPELIFRERQAVGGTELVWASMSANVGLANASIKLFANALRALGYTEVSRRSKETVARLEPATFFVREWSTSSPGAVEFLDAHGVKVEYRSFPASITGASGYTAPGMTLDEVGAWECANPGQVVETAGGRTYRQRGAHQYLVSRAFSVDDVLYRMAMRGDSEGLFVARLGERGAADDERARLWLRDHLRARGDFELAADERLIEQADPSSPLIPAWVGLSPAEESMADAWSRASAGAGLEVGETPLDGLFRVYGGRPGGAEGERLFKEIPLRECRKLKPPSGKGPRAFALDPASLRDSFGGAGVERRRDYVVPIWLQEWAPSAAHPLDVTREVGPQAIGAIRSLGGERLTTDTAELAELILACEDLGFPRPTVEGGDMMQRLAPLRLVITRRALCLASDDPELDKLLAIVTEDLGRVTLTRRQGRVDVSWPTTGRSHGDVARALARAVKALAGQPSGPSLSAAPGPRGEASYPGESAY